MYSWTRSAYLYKTDVRTDGINDPEEVLLFGHVDANRQIGALALDGFEEGSGSRVWVLGSPVSVCLFRHRFHSLDVVLWLTTRSGLEGEGFQVGPFELETVRQIR